MPNINLLLGQKSLGDYRKAEEEFQMKKRAAQMESQVKQAQIEKAQKELTTGGVGGATGELVNRLMAENPGMSFGNALGQIQTGYRKGIEFGRDGVTPIKNLPTALGQIAQGEKFGGESGTQQAKDIYVPARESKIFQDKRDIEATTAPDIEAGKIFGKGTGEAQDKYATFMSNRDGLMSTAEELKKLANIATYTRLGKFSNEIKRQLGTDVGDAAEARAKMETMIDIQVLPILKPTFGAQFTVVEGKWLKDTLGNPDLSPGEKRAQIDARVRGWDLEAEALKSRATATPLTLREQGEQQFNQTKDKVRLKYNSQTGEFE